MDFQIVHQDENRLVLQQRGMWHALIVGILTVGFGLFMVWGNSVTQRLTCDRASHTPMQCRETQLFLGIPYAVDEIGALRGARLETWEVGRKSPGKRVSAVILVRADDTQGLSPHAEDDYGKGRIVNAINDYVQSPQVSHLDIALDVKGDESSLGIAVAIVFIGIGIIAGTVVIRPSMLNNWIFDRRQGQVFYRRRTNRGMQTDEYALRDISDVHIAGVESLGTKTYRVELVTYERTIIPLTAEYNQKTADKERIAKAIREFLRK